MKTLFKILGFSFLGLLLLGMFFTILNNGKNTKIDSSNTFSVPNGHISLNTISGTGSNIVASGNVKVNKLLVKKEILRLSNIRKKNKEINILKNRLSLKKDISILKNTISKDKKKISKEDKKNGESIKKELRKNIIGNNIDLSGVNLKTGVNFKYTIGVMSLKINDISFKKKSGYLFLGDLIKQLDISNIRGCFKMEVLDSKNQNNIGKIGYVCKKYLNQYIEDKYINDIVEVNDFIKTSVGDIFGVISPYNKKITDKSLSIIKVGSIVEQIEEADIYGCFKILVIKSYGINKDLGKVGYVCRENLEKILSY